MLTGVLRAIVTLAAGIWLGGIVTIAIVAATTFGEMRRTAVTSPNAIAGQVMARNFQRFDYVQITCASVLLLWSAAVLATKRRSLRDWTRFGVIAGACALWMYNVNVNTPKILGMQSIVANADVEADVRARFEEFHRSAVRVSQTIMILLVIAGIELAMPTRRSPAM